MLRKLRDRTDALSFQVERIVLDPGHGGFDSGAVGKNGLKEKDVTLALANGLFDKLKRKNQFQVFSTRDDDYYVPLGERTATANQRKADLFVSFHINAAENRKASGSETYYCSETASNEEAARLAAFENSVLRFDEEAAKKPGFLDIEGILFEFERKLYWGDSKQFAHKFQGRFGTQLELKDRGVQLANFYVLRQAKMPALLLETGFISNPDEEELLGQERFREKIVDGAFGAILEMSGA
ncbi:MAG: N-acetylmuramoyl-L-alanine amidase [Deltaproteobacteria bacterium]|nr:N-acetylmuramoyl-L-alanine amidase [Deltaproteobacteria bacterium]